jgi:hypothetical protein
VHLRQIPGTASHRRFRIEIEIGIEIEQIAGSACGGGTLGAATGGQAAHRALSNCHAAGNLPPVVAPQKAVALPQRRRA